MKVDNSAIQAANSSIRPEQPLTVATQGEPIEKNETSVRNADVVSISNEGKIKSEFSERVDKLLNEKGELIYKIAIKDLKSYPENLASKLDDQSLSDSERKDVMERLQKREMEAFSKYVQQVPQDKAMYFKKYVEYLDSLSPEEQLSERYAGQRAAARQAYAEISRRQNQEPDDLSFTQDPILALFDAIRENNFNIDNDSQFREEYSKKIVPLLSGNPSLIQDYELALNRFDKVQLLISAALAGEESAFNTLNRLGEGEIIFEGEISPS